MFAGESIVANSSETGSRNLIVILPKTLQNSYSVKTK
jgi:hypothetical protein